MAQDGTKPDEQSLFEGGIADFDKFGLPGSLAFIRSIDYRTNPREATITPKTTKESGSTVTDLVKWGERVTNTSYLYGNAGNIYSRSSVGSWSLLRSVANSHGNGLRYYGEDDFLYYTSDKVIGRYGPIAGTPTFADDYFGSQGGNPTNTYAVSFASASSQYDTRADTASLSITGDLALEAYIKPTTLPAVGSSMTICGKWNETGATRSYKFDIYGVSGYFGDGSTGALTVNVDTTDAPIDSAATGTIALSALSATNVSFASSQVILIHQTQGSGAGTWQRNSIQGYTAGTITTDTALNATYTSGAQVLVMKQYTNVTVNSGKTWTAKAWNGTVGGILAFLANGSITVTGSISAANCGFRGGAGLASGADSAIGSSGESTTGAGSAATTAANGTAGGGAKRSGGTGGAGAGGHATAGGYGLGNDITTSGRGGTTGGSADLGTMIFGGSGGGSAANGGGEPGPFTGGNSGGIIVIFGATLTVSGSITANGQTPSGSTSPGCMGAGGGSGGSILLRAQTATLGTSLVTASGGAGGAGEAGTYTGGAGGDGRIHIDYLTSYTGTTTPTLNATQDSTLVTTTTYQLRLGISNDGTANEYLTKNSTITTAAYFHVAVSWVASTSTATFYQNGSSLGTSVGTKTAIHDNASAFTVAANNGGSGITNFFNGLMDDLRVWGSVRTSGQIAGNKDRELAGTETGLKAYYKFNNAHTDLTANANDLTPTNSPTFSVDVPFYNPTTRVDIDQTAIGTGNSYTTPLAIDESSTSNKVSFVPAKDPQKSIQFNVTAKGTGNWTVTIHDAVNRTIATSTVTNANLNTGNYEFTYSSVWRPVIGQTYHAHITSTVADGTIDVGTASNLSTAGYTSYFQFLVSDSDYHPIETMLNFIAIGNERYVAKYDGSTYTFNALKLPAGWKVKCFAKWREYLVVGCWKGSNIYDYDEGIMFFWDGYSTTYNFFVTVPEGAVNSMFSSRGILFVNAGYQGDLLAYVGGDSADKVKRIPKIAKDKYTEIMPGAMNMWQGNLRVGVAGSSDSSVVERGVYTYGQFNKDHPMSLSYDYPISTGNRTASNIQIGLVYPLDRKLLISWKDNVSYGVDVVDPTGSPYSTATVERLIQDYGGVWKEKNAMVIRADFKDLVAGQTVTLKYKLDRAANWTSGTAVTSGNVARLPVMRGRHKEIQIAADLTTSISSSPTLLGLALQDNLLPNEDTF